MFSLRRAAVRTLSFHSSRQPSNLRSSTRVTRFQPAKPSLYRAFHQARTCLANEQSNQGDASPVESNTSGETVTTEPSAAELEVKSETSARADAVSESSGTTSEPLGQSEIKSKPVARQATEKSEQIIEQAKEQASTIPEGVTGTVSSIAQKATEAATATSQHVKSAINTTSQAASNTASAFGTAASQSGAQGRDNSVSADSSRGRNDSPPKPTRILYVGNLFFEVTAPNLESEFARFGEVTNSRVVTDNRGLSKGFGYVEFSTQDAADQAVRELDQKVFQGRRMAVQYHVPREAKGRVDRGGTLGLRGNKEPSVPSKTLFIGNMSYQMSDRDLNDLFRSIRNVLDVRVAIDRRSGQPRGFAHADFIDVESATKAKETLEKKVVYGRTLRVDYSGNSSRSRSEV